MVERAAPRRPRRGGAASARQRASPVDEFALLAEPLQAWVTERGWQLRPIQREATAAMLQAGAGAHDFVLSASTASGKTEAAFLPLLTWLHRRSPTALPSFEILYVSPLKALINDIHERAESMAACVGRRAFRRHGDVDRQQREGSRGILLTTPESLEARFVRTPEEVEPLFRDLQAVIVDEIHAYFESPRGSQVISLLGRLEALLAKSRNEPALWIPRVALSATVGSREQAAVDLRKFLRPHQPDQVTILCPEAVENPVRVHLKAFKQSTPGMAPVRTASAVAGTASAAPETHQPVAIHHKPPEVLAICRDLLQVFGARAKGLIFTNSRHETELYADILNELAREEGLVERPCKEADDLLPACRRFWPHHGSLDRSIRGKAEAVMRNQKEKSILVCTTTLELGIDVGQVEATAQIGPGFSVASLRQRLGRSGRREGMEPTLHAYVRERELGDDADPLERLHLATFRTLAQINLLRQGVFEAPDLQRLNLSTLIQQLLSCTRQNQEDEGLDVQEARYLLIERGPFGTAADLLEPLIRHLVRKYQPLLDEQDGRYFLSKHGTSYIGRFTFYAAFDTPQEYTLRSGSSRLGSFAARYPYGPGDQLLFGGARWEVVHIDHLRHVLEVIRAAAGRAPFFAGDGLAPSHPVVQEMRRIYRSAESPRLPPDSNALARRIVREGRRGYEELFAHHERIIAYGPQAVLLFPWVGTRKQTTLVTALKWMGLAATAMDVAVLVRDATPAVVERALRDFLASSSKPSEYDLARYGSKPVFEKHDRLLSPALKRLNYASAKLDIASLESTVEGLLLA